MKTTPRTPLFPPGWLKSLWRRLVSVRRPHHTFTVGGYGHTK